MNESLVHSFIDSLTHSFTECACQEVGQLPFENASIDHLAQHLSKKMSSNRTAKNEEVKKNGKVKVKINNMSQTIYVSCLLCHNNFVNSP